MGRINSLNEPWDGHDGSEVEEFLKDKLRESSSDIGERYIKPSEGIPATDLAGEIDKTLLTNSVQESLNKADTAYQKPSGGIPSTDMASSVKFSLDKANTAIQPSDIADTPKSVASASATDLSGNNVEEVCLKNRANNNPQAPRTLARLVTDSGKNRPLNESLTKLAEYQSLGFPAFSVNVDYAEGEPCFHDRKLFKAKAGGHSAGTWDGSHFEEFSVKEYTDAHVSIFDVSANNDGAVFASLRALLSDADLNTLIPAPFRRGGITITFIQGENAQSSDNKYVQYFCTASSFSTDEADWQKMNLEEDVSQLGQELGNAVVIPVTEDGKYIALNTGVGNSIGGVTSLGRFCYMRYPVTEGDKVIVNGTGGGAPRLWAFVDDDEIILKVAEASITATNLELIAPQNAAEVIINTEDKTVSSYFVSGNSIKNQIANIQTADVNAMIASKDWRVSGNVTYDSNEIPVSYNITWADGESGTVVMSNFNSDVFEYTTITVTYKTKTIVYTLTYDSNGYVTNETYVEQ